MDEQSGEGEAKIELPQEFVSLANKNLPLSANRALRYLKERGITQEQIVRWKMGFCYDGEYGGRIIVPSFGTSGYPNYFIARSYVGHNMKYKNPRSSKNVVFNDLFTNWNDDLVIVEGVFDAINAGNAVPILGYEMTPRATSPSILMRLKKSGVSFKRFCATMWNSIRSM
jgi:DNA primase